MNKPIIGISLYLDLVGIDEDDLLLPGVEDHRRWVDENGISIFNLPPYSMTQVIIAGNKTDWFYVDTGQDGHCVRHFHQAKKVLEQTMRMHSEANLYQLEILRKEHRA